jgi:hypothetical protein
MIWSSPTGERSGTKENTDAHQHYGLSLWLWVIITLLEEMSIAHFDSSKRSWCQGVAAHCQLGYNNHRTHVSL